MRFLTWLLGVYRRKTIRKMHCGPSGSPGSLHPEKEKDYTVPPFGEYSNSSKEARFKTLNSSSLSSGKMKWSKSFSSYYNV